MNTKKVIKALKIMLIALSVSAITLVGVGYFVIKDIWGNPLKYLFDQQNRDHKITLDDGTKVEFNQDIVNILLLGTDSDAERVREHLGYRADSNILLSVNLTDFKGSMVGFPRDTWVEQDIMDSKGKSKGKTMGKLAHAFSGNSGVSGRELLNRSQNSKRCIERIINSTGLRIPIDNTIVIDMDGLVKIVDAVGGVDFHLEDTVPGIGKAGQTVTLNGKKALELVRNRKGVSGGDLGRVDHQQQFLIALARKIKEKGAVKLIPTLVSSLGTAIEHDMDMDTILALAKALDQFDLDGMKMQTVPGTSNGKGGIDLDAGELKKILLDIYYVEKKEAADSAQ